MACRQWVEERKKTSCRLFANYNVQYYGYERDYTNLLSDGEHADYAGYSGGRTSDVTLKEMEVYVNIADGDDLTIGIKTGNRRNDGTVATDNSGWFKVDFFRIQRLTPADNGAAQHVTSATKHCLFRAPTRHTITCLTHCLHHHPMTYIRQFAAMERHMVRCILRYSDMRCSILHRFAFYSIHYKMFFAFLLSDITDIIHDYYKQKQKTEVVSPDT